MFVVIAVTAILIQSWLIYLFLFGPTLPYNIPAPPAAALDSDEFLRLLEAMADDQFYQRSQVEVLTNGEVYYEAELQAIRAAQQSVNLEAYIFLEGEVTRRFVAALTARARAGVRVNVVLDAFGSRQTSDEYFQTLRAAGGRIARYHTLRLHNLPYINNRTHRELIIIDGRVGFTGGSGFSDKWLTGDNDKPRWRDTMFRVEGDVVREMQSTFAENWLAASGEVLTAQSYYPDIQPAGQTTAMIANSSPVEGRGTRARMLYQTLLAAARQRIDIATPYFLPDQSLRDELIRAIKERGVQVRIVAPGRDIDWSITRLTSRRLYGELLAAGAQIYEYQPGMIHVKALIIDELWSVVGTANVDHRSFGLNDEVNLVVRDAAFAARLSADFARDVAASRAISYAQWQERPISERLLGWLGWTLQRQQ